MPGDTTKFARAILTALESSREVDKGVAGPQELVHFDGGLGDRRRLSMRSGPGGCPRRSAPPGTPPAGCRPTRRWRLRPGFRPTRLRRRRAPAPKRQPAVVAVLPLLPLLSPSRWLLPGQGRAWATSKTRVTLVSVRRSG